MNIDKKMVREPLEYYIKLKYPVTITADESGGFVAEIEILPGCFTQGDTIEETYENMEEARRLWIESAYEDNLDIPLPRTDDEYSGKFYIRTPKILHKKLIQQAEREGVSLNQFLVASLAHTVGYAEAVLEKTKRVRHSKVNGTIIHVKRVKNSGSVTSIKTNKRCSKRQMNVT